ncbi:hypothetical protein Tco_0288668, partial [Tanacetum coccineum]
MLRLCHRMMACSIAGRSQAPEKVTVIDLFAAGRKSGAHISGGHFVGRLAQHFRLLTTGEQLNDTWAWVAMGLERQRDVAGGAPGVAQD